MARTAKGRTARGVPSMAVRRACFLEVLRRTGNVSRAAREAGLASSTAYGQRGRMPAFAAEWDAAVNEAMDELEAQLLDRAKHGTERPVFFRGEQVGSVRSYSDALAMFLLRARRPQIYDRPGATAGPVRPVDDMTEEEAKAEVVRRLDLIAAHAEREAAAARADAPDADGEDGDGGQRCEGGADGQSGA